MKHKNFWVALGILWTVLLLVPHTAYTQTTKDACLLLSVQTISYPSTRISWDAPDNAAPAIVWVRNTGSHDWIKHSEVSAMPWTIEITDTAELEIQVVQQWTLSNTLLVNSGYAQIHREQSSTPAAEKVVVIADDGVVAAAHKDLQRLVDDLRLEGWVASIITVSRNSSPTLIKSLIHDAYTDSSKGKLTHVFFVGAVPYATSGGFSVRGAVPNPDYHPEHGGAWASDAYYADMFTSQGVDAEYQWTDEYVSITDTAIAKRGQNQNVPGDGKFDQSQIPTDLEISIGRLDMADLQTFGTTANNRDGEYALIRKYLNKDHDYRTHAFEPPKRALIDDVFGLFNYTEQGIQYIESFAASGWRSFAPIVGADNIIMGDWIPDKPERPSLDTFGVLLAYGCGPGGYEHCDYVANTTDLSAHANHSVFTLLFGSYFGDVASTDNLLRSVLAQDGWTLTSGWAGRPQWYVHQLAAGATIGECARTTANNADDYWGSVAIDSATHAFAPYPLGNRGVHIILLGDPTLRIPSPYLQGSISITEGDDETTLAWSAAVLPDACNYTIKYVIEGSSSITLPFTVLATTTQTSHTLAIPKTMRFVRVRPYANVTTATAPIAGRGIIEPLPIQITSVVQSHEESARSGTYRWFDCLGREQTHNTQVIHGMFFGIPHDEKDQMQVLWK